MERAEVRAAIALVASGAASRVVVAGLDHARELIVRLRGRATIGGVVLTPVPRTRPRGVLVTHRPTPVA